MVCCVNTNACARRQLAWDGIRPITEDDTRLRVLVRGGGGRKDRKPRSDHWVWPLFHVPEHYWTIYHIVAIHGIGAHPEDTLCKDVGTDEGGQRYIDRLQGPGMLPLVVPNARILRYGYESQWFGADVIRQKTSTVANRFLLEPSRERNVWAQTLFCPF